MKRLAVIFGTRPEAIKLAPVILELTKCPDYKLFVCNTEQQREFSNETVSFFCIEVDRKLDIMTPNQTLSALQSRMITALEAIYADNKFDATIVQGDTMTAFCGGLVSFYHKVPLFHIEAGLRSGSLSEPFPEEGIRQMLARIADLHFCPTKSALDALINEGISPAKLYNLGNTVVDALLCLPSSALSRAESELEKKGINLRKKIVLVTVHRRENHGDRLEEILRAVSDLADKFSEHQFVIPVHLNPNVRNKIFGILSERHNVILTSSFNYPEMVCMLKTAELILTDSGGVQEEAPSCGVPLLILRYKTERHEGVEAGYAKLVGADYSKIVDEASVILGRNTREVRSGVFKNPYGDGNAAKKIADVIKEFWA